jgi:hypothetical protein
MNRGEKTGPEQGLPSGARRIRTADLLGAIQALCQLSYSPEMADLQGMKVCETADTTRIL